MDFTKNEIVKTRKIHKCWGCAKEFPIGTKMHRQTTKDNDIRTDYWCGKCVDKLQKLYKEQIILPEDGIDFGELNLPEYNLL
jgi:predicted SprT family Zn-dependent metalloprotease